MTAAPRDPIAWEDTLPVRPSSPAWRAIVKALYGSPLTEAEAELVDRFSGGAGAPVGGATDFLGVVGRRGGKSSTIARIAVFEALYGGHAVALEPGQVGTFAVVCPSREQAKEIIGYVAGLCALPSVRPFLESDPTADAVTFRTRVRTSILTCDAVTARGFTYVGLVADELAFWPDDDAAQSDRQILDAMTPGLAPIAGAPPRRFLAITSANLEEGIAWETYRDCYGFGSAPTFVVSGTTVDFNPNIDRDWLAKQQRKRPAAYLREHESHWGGVVEAGFFPAEAVSGCTDVGRASGYPVQERGLVAAIDAAFLSDRFTLALATGDDDRVWVHGVWAWSAPRGQVLSPRETVAAIVKVLRVNNLSRVSGDQHAFAPLAELFREKGVTLRQVPWTGTSKPDTYRTLRTALIDRRVRLPDEPELRKELLAIASKPRRDGGERIEARRGHDDRVSALALAYADALRAGRRHTGPVILPMTRRL